MKMYDNEISQIIPILKSGTNSTMFTECCKVAICENEPYCPRCKGKVIGWDAKTYHKRNMIRWANAIRFW